MLDEDLLKMREGTQLYQTLNNHTTYIVQTIYSIMHIIHRQLKKNLHLKLAINTLICEL